MSFKKICFHTASEGTYDKSLEGSVRSTGSSLRRKRTGWMPIYCPHQ